ncbi:hypothetical protein V1264_004254 [Littorina saxatilis]|uniref:CUB domain-containing protein n=1 Tax=Littorina saxatilis TaxID=31220 RepID=A0AAN9G6L5_9CAEN
MVVFGQLLLTNLHFLLFFPDSLYSLVPPEVYVVFGGDLEVVFQMPGDVSVPNAFVRLQGRRPADQAWTEITTMGLPLGAKTGTLSAACGIVEFAGKYSLTMYMQVDGPVLTEVTFYAAWPSVVLRLPKTHYALTSQVPMEIDSRASCAPKLHREFLTLELYFQRIEDSGNAYAKLSDAEMVLAENFTAINKGAVKKDFACETFDLDGSYQVLLRSSSGSTLAVSNVMSLTFSASYHLQTMRRSVFPCPEDSTFEVLYSKPPCAGVDKLRVHKLEKQAPGSPASPLERVYVGEFETDPDKTGVKFNCSLFQENATGYCFDYVTVSKRGAVAEQKQLCLSAQPDAVLIQDGGWSPWTTWTSCSVTCGSGKRSRFRMCNDPLPEPGGRFCKGHSVQWTDCQVPCPDSLPRTPLRSPDFDPSCHCGCTRTTDSGEIIASGRCKGLATWIIKTEPGEQVTLTFRYYDILYERQWVKVRDGESQSDELLFFSHDQSSPHDVTSSSNVMRVELMTEVIMSSPAAMTVFPRNASLPIHVHGFIASYSAKATLSAAKLPPPLFRHVEPSVMQSAVTIVGIVVCVLVVVAVVIVAVVRQRYWRRMPKYSVANNEESPRHLVHSSSAQSSNPSSPGPHVQVDMDIPLTGGSGARRKSSSGQQRAASRASSISSTCSATLKKIRSRAEGATTPGSTGGGGGLVCNGSPKPSSKDYSNLDSPYSKNATPDDSVHDANFFKASPILKHVAPRSPKVHPHKLKASPGTPSSPGPSPSMTKHELLTRKRQGKKGGRGGGSTPVGEAEGERQVTGSSGSGSTSASKPDATVPATSATSTLTKAEINLTKPPSSGSSSRLGTPSDSRASSSGKKLRSPVDPKPFSAKAGPSKRHHYGNAAEQIPLMDSTDDIPSPLHQPKTEPKKTPTCEETSFIYPITKVRRPTSLTESYSIDTIESRGSSRSRTPKSPAPVVGRPSAMEERQTLLPKPDGQSPKSPREETLGAEKEEEKSSKSSSSSPSKLSMTSNKTMSPTRSIATPELEYDDFIMDDPLSYFEYDELNKLNWTGTEKLSRTQKKEDS